MGISATDGNGLEIVSNIEMKPGMPYFIAPDVEGNITWVGELPEIFTIDLKYVPGTFSENYIVLPLNTEIKKVSQLCDIKDEQGNLIINQEEELVWWNPKIQDFELSERTCSWITAPNSPFDFELEPGKVYLIIVQRNASWQQK
jgi:hypothetical protein